MDNMDAARLRPDAIGAGIGLGPFDDGDGGPRPARHVDAVQRETQIRQQRLQPPIPRADRGGRIAPPGQGVIADEDMFGIGGKPVQHGLHLAAIDRVEKLADAAANDGVIHHNLLALSLPANVRTNNIQNTRELDQPSGPGRRSSDSSTLAST